MWVRPFSQMLDALRKIWVGGGITDPSLDSLASLLPSLTFPCFPLSVFPLGNPMKMTKAPHMEAPAEHLLGQQPPSAQG